MFCFFYDEGKVIFRVLSNCSFLKSAAKVRFLGGVANQLFKLSKHIISMKEPDKRRTLMSSEHVCKIGLWRDLKIKADFIKRG